MACWATSLDGRRIGGTGCAAALRLNRERHPFAARAQGVATFLDGARLWNAAVALGRPPAALAAPLAVVVVEDAHWADPTTAAQTYYGCQLFYAGCTADADVQAHLFPDGLTEQWTPVMFASQRQSMAGVLRALREHQPAVSSQVGTSRVQARPGLSVTTAPR